MTVVSGRGAHVPLLLEAVMVTRLSVTVTALLKKVLMLMRKVKVFVVMMMMGVFLSLSSPSTPTPTTRPCRACLTQNFSKAGDPDLGRGERTNWGGNLPVARFLFLLARHQEEARVINLCFSDRGCLFASRRYGPPRDARDERHVCPTAPPAAPASLRRAGVQANKSTTRSVLMERISFDLAAHGHTPFPPVSTCIPTYLPRQATYLGSWVGR